MKPLFCFIGFLLLMVSTCFSQGGYIIKNKKGSDKIKFQLINNVIIIPVEVNGVSLSFLLDTGVSRPILFNFLKASDSLEILNAERIYLKGLGNDGLIEALKSSNNEFKIGDAVNPNQSFYVVFDSSINFAPKLGVPIHGIIGFDLFKDFVVNINYRSQFIRLTNPSQYKYRNCNSCEVFNLEFHNDKPYFSSTAILNENSIPVKLLVDTGSSDSLWLFENDSLGIDVGSNYFDDFLGYGLSGAVRGKRSKIDAIKLNSFQLKNPKVAFPDSLFTKAIKKIEGRNGSVGGELLSRFNVTLDYRKAEMTLRKNSNFNDEFSYNKSGIDLEHDGVRLVTESIPVAKESSNLNGSHAVEVKAIYTSRKKYVIKPLYSISQIREDSPADRAGLKKGDQLIKINNSDTKNFSLQELMGKFFDEEGKRVRLLIERNGEKMKFNFKLESILK